ncbi:hypothetical protein FCL47_08930 [Desulfopila sp. IMCC35006]|uniref:prenylated flavin chaperone LpdD n=1 Tax=Desulfopila sp. IMCC35006 TaxID=2569542 RepID=UPI0010AC23A5|nr:hypothetical protein [Desulfopila sp. IMCC35006]TKB26527.1 hypothetical protein FCL47_08930 [Desulfopila sp. IMCC35006]
MIQAPRFFRIDQDGFTVEACCMRMGDDYLLSIWGGTPHIGAVAMAQPRDSLQDPARRSATASVFCYVGHKEDQVVKEVSERMSRELNTKVVVAAGLHWDELTPAGAAQVLRSVNVLITEIIQQMLTASK